MASAIKTALVIIGLCIAASATHENAVIAEFIGVLMMLAGTYNNEFEVSK